MANQQAISDAAVQNRLTSVHHLSHHIETTMTGVTDANNTGIVTLVYGLLNTIQDVAPKQADWKWHQLRLAEIKGGILGDAAILPDAKLIIITIMNEIDAQFVMVAHHYDMTLAREMMRKHTLTATSQALVHTRRIDAAELAKLKGQLKKLRSGGHKPAGKPYKKK